MYIGAIASMSFYFVPDHPPQSLPAIAAGITTICITSYIYGNICANGYLPILARRSATLAEPVVPSSEDLARRDPSPYARRNGSTERQPLLPDKDVLDTSLITSRMSSLGMACGLVIAVVIQYFVHMALNQHVKISTCFAACGTWYAIAAIPSIVFLPGHKELAAAQVTHARDEEDMEDGRGSGNGTDRSPRSMSRMIDVVKSVNHMPNLRNLLLNWVIASDGVLSSRPER